MSERPTDSAPDDFVYVNDPNGERIKCDIAASRVDDDGVERREVHCPWPTNMWAYGYDGTNRLLSVTHYTGPYGPDLHAEVAQSETLPQPPYVFDEWSPRGSAIDREEATVLVRP
jgi:hypothetical protein